MQNAEAAAPRVIGNTMLTTWHNPTTQTVKLRLFRHGKIVRQGRVVDSGVDIVEIAPGERVTLPSFLDETIQERRHGMIVSGLAPQLVKEGDPAPVHPSLDPVQTAKREAEKAAARALEAKKSADTALVIAEGTIAAAEAAEAQTEKAKTKKAKADQS